MPPSASAFGKNPVFAALLLAAALALFSLFPTASRAEALQKLQIVTTTGAHEFQVELADSPEKRAKGLMYRRSMPQDHGMLFDFHQLTPVMMWMKNTYIPLDMVFVSHDGVVTNVATDAKPMSEDIISSGDPAYAVIELNAGVAREIGLAPGDTVRHPAFRR